MAKIKSVPFFAMEIPQKRFFLFQEAMRQIIRPTAALLIAAANKKMPGSSDRAVHFTWMVIRKMNMSKSDVPEDRFLMYRHTWPSVRERGPLVPDPGDNAVAYHQGQDVLCSPVLSVYYMSRMQAVAGRVGCLSVCRYGWPTNLLLGVQQWGRNRDLLPRHRTSGK